MSDATTPANPTDQIATTPAVLSPETPIAPTSGTKRVPDDNEAAVVRDAQQYDWRLDLHLLDRRARDKYEEGDGAEADRLTDHIEYLEDLLNGYRSLYADMCDEYASLKAVKRSKEHCKRNRDNWKARALKAEAMSEWLAGRATMIERELGKQPTWDSSDDWLKAASEAVSESIDHER